MPTTTPSLAELEHIPEATTFCPDCCYRRAGEALSRGDLAEAREWRKLGQAVANWVLHRR